MKTHLLSLALILALPVAAGEKSQAPKTLPGGWVLEWNDEFNGSKLNPKKWQPELGVIRNVGASQTYTQDCILLKKGMLVLKTEARETPVSNFKEGSTKWFEQRKTMPYKSGSITTRGIKSFSTGAWRCAPTFPATRGPGPLSGSCWRTLGLAPVRGNRYHGARLPAARYVPRHHPLGQERR